MFRTGTGLPVVLPPAKGEMLGSWLMRIAQFYGLSINSLLSRVGARDPRTGPVPHWFALRPSVIDVAQLASALRVQPSQLSTMAPPRCRPHWPTELGMCRACLEEAAASQQPVTWSRQWMHPLAVVCRGHRCWLTPVATCDLGRIRSTEELLSIRTLVEPAHGVDRDNLSDALWAQRTAFSKTGAKTPWGQAGPPTLLRVLHVADNALASASDQEMPELGLSSDWQRSKAKDFKLEHEHGGILRLALPQGLVHRQWLMGAAGHILRRPPSRRRMLATLPDRAVKALASSWFSASPPGLMQWISPEAAALQADQHEQFRSSYGRR
jgi:hypothetical protein